MAAFFTWLFALLFGALPAAPQPDYVGFVAAEAAYAAAGTDAVAPVKPKVATEDCTRCNGTGRIPTGDSNHPWTKCPDCDPSLNGNAGPQPPRAEMTAPGKFQKSAPLRSPIPGGQNQ